MNLFEIALEQTNIVSSTGLPGIGERSYGRLYHNNNEPVEDIRQLEEGLTQLQQIAATSNNISRVVLRGVLNQNAHDQLAGSTIHTNVEVLAPLEAHGHSGQYLYYVAQNSPGRETIRPIQEMLAETSIRPLVRSNLTIAPDRTVRDLDAERLLELWGHTFGWEEDQIHSFITRIQRSHVGNVASRSVWFSGLRATDGQLISVAMAERLDLQTFSGVVPLIESTEWRTHPDHTGQGHMTETLTGLNGHVSQDLRGQHPFIFAECNFQSRSDLAGSRAGFVIPDRTLSNQIIRQNVVVEDDTGLPENSLRDFTFLMLPAGMN